MEQRGQEPAQYLLSLAAVLPHTTDCSSVCWCAAAGTADWDPQPHRALSPATRAETVTLKRSKVVKCTHSTKQCTAPLRQLCQVFGVLCCLLVPNNFYYLAAVTGAHPVPCRKRADALVQPVPQSCAVLG